MGRNVRELLKTNDPVLISLVEAVLSGEGIRVFVADQHMSALEGSIGILPRRLLVAEDDLFRARVVVSAAGVAHDQLTAPRAGASDGDNG
jgi:Putative prokaryotic signal transducing protein